MSKVMWLPTEYWISVRDTILETEIGYQSEMVY